MDFRGREVRRLLVDAAGAIATVPFSTSFTYGVVFTLEVNLQGSATASIMGESNGGTESVTLSGITLPEPSALSLLDIGEATLLIVRKAAAR